MVRRVVGIVCVALGVVGLEAGPIFAQSGHGQSSDPRATSPAGVEYSIPLDSARQDAAPHGHGGAAGFGGGSAGGGGGGTGGGGGGGSAGGGTSAGGGSSSAGGGATQAGSSGGSGHGSLHAAASARVAGGSAVLVPGGQPGSLIHSGNGFGSSSRVPGLNGPTSPGLAAVSDGGSSAPTLALVLAAVVLLVGGFAGIRAARGPRPTSR
jgi:hypothetical protein